MIRPFQPMSAGAIAQANATSSAGGSLPETCNVVALYNSSATAVVFWECRTLTSTADAGPTAVVPASGGATGGFPIPPGQLIRVTVAPGIKKYATIASAADGILYITPGQGN
ncbi:hypothetical protein [Novosphingobium sp. MMS21-SN21R]|uniref:hypothetical protein n=1 Tax=Novosphingobium sp. MMS21-SN21R TaxID=2969298 RepID=UPI002886DD66|nr:hypothetical protein [Novosphingobium sp. MMS21-SN21R]MDT0507529.1 hypothetical protein [Novosphingobium sp. MMS21-SN21R]